MKKIHTPDSELYEKYYTNQAGGTLATFHGTRIQRGYGLGGILRGMFNWLLPHAKTAAKTIGNEALRTGVGVTQDVMQGQDFQSSIKSRAANSVRGLAKRAAINGDQSQTGGGQKAIKRKTSDTSVSSPAAKRKKTTRQKFYICLEEKKKKK